jgi:hypothetical protein
MTPATPPHSFWFGDGEPIPAEERLRRVVAGLVRARRLQLLVDHASGGVLAGLGLATAVVLLTRLVPSSYSTWQLGTAAAIIPLAVALVVGWRRRPDALDVAIRADLALKLKQRLSTAWEFMTRHGDRELAGRLAAQAVKARLPVSSALVFPLRVNRWGRLAPVAAAALLLAGVLDLDWRRPQAPPEVDERVVSEGQRLGAFARAMQDRARREQLPRSDRQARSLERLGARMESGALARAQALEQLRQLGLSLDEDSLQVLADVNEAAPPMGGERSGRWPEASGLNPGAMPDPSTKGALHAGDPHARNDGRDGRGRSGMPRRDGGDAAKRLAAGTDEAGMTPEEPEPRYRARKEHEELGRARDVVRRAREKLRESTTGVDDGGTRAAERDAASGEESGGDDPEDGRRGGGTAGNGSFSALHGGSGAAEERQKPPFFPDSRPSGPVLKPRGQVGAGEPFVFQGRVLPNDVRPGVESVEVNRQFAREVEEVLSREHYPAHYKELVRRYFLSLSQGGLPSHQQPSGAR